MRPHLLFLAIFLAAIVVLTGLSTTGSVPGNVTLVVPSNVTPPGPGPGPGGGGGGGGGGGAAAVNVTPNITLPTGAAFIVATPAADEGTITGINLTAGYWCANLSDSVDLPWYSVCFYTTGPWPFWEIIMLNVTRPDFLPAIESQFPDELAYQYMNVTIIGNPPEDMFRDITFNFRVSKAWMNSNFISPASIKLARYNGGWGDLPTYLIGQDEKYVRFDTHFSPGFSYFVIHGTPRPSLLPLPEFVVARLDLFLVLLMMLIIMLLYLLAGIRRTKLDIRRMERIKALQRIKRWKRRK